MFNAPEGATFRSIALAKNEDEHGARHVHLTIVVNGQPTVVTEIREALLGVVIPKALSQTGNAGQPPENWELRDAAGAVLNLGREIAEYQFPPDVKLFLNLKAGVGG